LTISASPVDRVEEFFDEAEFESRRQRVRAVLRERDLDAILVSSPENVYYLAGLNHYGYFAVTILILPLDGPPLLFARAMEAPTIAEQCRDIRHLPFGDAEDPGEVLAVALRSSGLAGARLGIELDHMFLPPRVAQTVQRALPTAWTDASGIVEELRMVKSAAELAYTREAARISDRAAGAAIAAAGSGVNERHIAAEVYRTMIDAGGDLTGFPALIRSDRTLRFEHIVWRDHELDKGERLFVELAGCVRRYHAPQGRLLFIGPASDRDRRAADVTIEAIEAAQGALHPGAISGDVYAAWQAVVDRAAGSPQPKRHHVGYGTGLGFPPSWVGASMVPGIRPDGRMVIREGMVFHLMSWLVGSALGDYLVSDTAVITATGVEILTTTPRVVQELA